MANKFTNTEVLEARRYWSSLTEKELREFHRHYTDGKGRGMYSGVNADTSFNDYLVLSARQSAHEYAMDL